MVITCVTRDDLPDGGAEHFVQTIDEISQAGRGQCQFSRHEGRSLVAVVTKIGLSPISISLLPDHRGLALRFRRQRGGRRSADRGGAGGLQPQHGNRAAAVSDVRVRRAEEPDYAWTLEMFRRIRRGNPAIALKTGLMLGLGETTEELLDTLADLLEAGCRMLTLGQYLQPSPAQMPVVRYVPPEEFEHLGSWPGGWASTRGQRPVRAIELSRAGNDEPEG